MVNEVVHDEIRKEVQEKMGAMKQEMEAEDCNLRLSDIIAAV